MIRFIRNLSRLLHIARVLARHDALFLLDHFGIGHQVALLVKLTNWRKAPGRPGQRLAAALIELGPSFIKFGQTLSTRSDILGDEIAADLSELQDRLEPFPGPQARATVEAELAQPLDSLFSSFDDVPVAAASIAQVHFAVTTEGREVAVKVLRPGIEEAFARDLDFLMWLAEIVEATQPSLRRLKPVETVRTIEETVTLEMDLRFEAAAAAEMAENFAGDDSFSIPEVDWTRTAKRTLTLERVHGIPVDERERLIEAGFDPKALVEKAAVAFFNQVFRDGFFHADMHPGNMFVSENGQLIAVDFGITGRIDLATRRYLGEMLLGFLTGDYKRAAEVHFEAGYVPGHKSVEQFAQACRSIAEPILGRPLAEISIARLLGQLFQITETFEMEVQPQLLLLQKSMLVTEGVGRTLCPELNMWFLARPLVEGWMADHLGPLARLKDAVTGKTGGLSSIPHIIAQGQRVAGMLSSQGLRLHPDTLNALTTGRKRKFCSACLLAWSLVLVMLVVILLR
ncbi:MAG: 2-polyprenylphenol 6-hydroxylase [Rhodospirillales bacterium]|nr:2-polyprenylphenol 6-hydroxylase [Rhodospirillales bacterium]